MSKRLGMNAKFYRSATLATVATNAGMAAKTWIEVSNIRDLTQNLETGEADVTTRANSGWHQTLATLKDGSLEFEMVWDTTDANFATFRTAWLYSQEIAVAAMSGDITVNGEEGLAGNFTVTNFTRGEPLDDAIKVNVTLKPSSYNTWFVVGGAS